MEKEFEFQQALPNSGEDSATATAAAAAIDEAYFSGICAGLSFRSLLAADPRDPLKPPKTEPLYNFFAETAPSPLRHQLPGLLSYEPPENQQQNAAAAGDSPAPNPRSEADPSGRRPRRRQPCRLSDKTHRLRKLLPGDEKMDMATVLEEAHKYIRFLRSQVSALRRMPCRSADDDGCGAATSAAFGGDLPKLNRQQLLRAVTNSPAMQAQLCAEGCCVYAAEQLLPMKKIADQKAALIDREMMYGSSNPNLFKS